MPDLSGLVGHNLPRRTTLALVGGRADWNPKAWFYVNALAQLTDRAAYAYEQARTLFSRAAAGSYDEQTDTTTWIVMPVRNGD
jgi:hypothetical protein